MDYFYTDEQKMLRDTVRRFAEESILPAAAGIDRDDVFPHEIYRGMAELGLYGVSLPEAAGGSGYDTHDRLHRDGRDRALLRRRRQHVRDSRRGRATAL